MPKIRAVVRSVPQSWFAIAVLLVPTSAHPGDIPSRLPEYVFEDNLTDAERTQLAACVAKVRKSVFYVGHPKGVHGTAFLVSRERRLLATAAHVADIMSEDGSLIAIPDGSTAWYRVQRVYYHPGVMRELDEGLHVRSDRVEDGEVSRRGPDVALLELAPGGPDLPEACVLATDDELRAMDHSTLVLIGFPGVIHDAWPPGVRELSADVVVERLCSMQGFGTYNHVEAPFERCQWVRYVGPMTDSGTSGGPVCLPNGHVAAVHTHRLAWTLPDVSNTGSRVDCIRELLVDVATRPEQPAGAIALGPAPSVNPRLPTLREAVTSLKDAEDLLDEQQYSGCVAICNQLVKSTPEYGRCYSTRAFAYYSFACSFELGSKEYHQYTCWARDDYLRASQMDPDLARFKAQFLDLRLMLTFPQADDATLRALVAEASSEIERAEPGTSEIAPYLSVRADCRMMQKDLAGARADVDEAIRLVPDSPIYWKQRARILDRLKQTDAATASRHIAKELAGHED